MSAGGSSDRGDPTDPEAGALDLIRFFRALRPEARREYDALAARDREYGEDVAAERCASGGGKVEGA
jgi:hypothetical protein